MVPNIEQSNSTIHKANKFISEEKRTGIYIPKRSLDGREGWRVWVGERGREFGVRDGEREREGLWLG